MLGKLKPYLMTFLAVVVSIFVIKKIPALNNFLFGA